MIYLAPLQGYTDYIYRSVYSEHFKGISAYFIPYISIHNKKPLSKQITELLSENNQQERVVPQVLIKDKTEFLQLADIIQAHGYKEMNINMGCPYPMVTKRGKGSGLLPHPDKVRSILDSMPQAKAQISIKLRSGLNNEDEIYSVIEVLNDYPLTEVIYHPRIAKQLYKGEIDCKRFDSILKKSKHKLVYNGDIISLDVFRKKQDEFPQVNTWMIGRGILMNPLLAEEINGDFTHSEEKWKRLKNFHDALFEAYNEKLSGPGHLLIRMKQFWEYFSHSFQNQNKTYKLIKKASTIEKYLNGVQEIFKICVEQLN